MTCAGEVLRKGQNRLKKIGDWGTTGIRGEWAKDIRRLRNGRDTGGMAKGDWRLGNSGDTGEMGSKEPAATFLWSTL